jgi:hypothetical protein
MQSGMFVKNINSNCIILISLSDISNYLMERECHK